MAEAVADASALIDLLLGNELGDAVQTRLAGHALHGTAHLRLVDALSVELAASRELPRITTDRRLGSVCTDVSSPDAPR